MTNGGDGMAIETHPTRAEPAGRRPSARRARRVLRPWWLRPGVHVGVIGAVIGYILGHLLGNFLSSAYAAERAVRLQRRADRARLRVRHHRLAGKPGRVQRPGPADAGQAAAGRGQAGQPARSGCRSTSGTPSTTRWSASSTCYGMIAYFLTGGLFAMAIRSELLSPSYHLLGPDQYLMVVGEARHDDDDDDVLGHPRPVRPVLRPAADRVQAGRVPRLEALGFWLTPAAYVILLSAVLLGGFPTGWTGYEPLATQATQGGMDAYFFAFGLMGISMIPAKLQHDRHHHQLYRAPGQCRCLSAAKHRGMECEHLGGHPAGRAADLACRAEGVFRGRALEAPVGSPAGA